jgi:hypothetical protein
MFKSIARGTLTALLIADAASAEISCRSFYGIMDQVEQARPATNPSLARLVPTSELDKLVEQAWQAATNRPLSSLTAPELEKAYNWLQSCEGSAVSSINAMRSLQSATDTIKRRFYQIRSQAEPTNAPFVNDQGEAVDRNGTPLGPRPSASDILAEAYTLQDILPLCTDVANDNTEWDKVARAAQPVISQQFPGTESMKGVIAGLEGAISRRWPDKATLIFKNAELKGKERRAQLLAANPFLPTGRTNTVVEGGRSGPITVNPDLDKKRVVCSGIRAMSGLFGTKIMDISKPTLQAD